MVRPVAASTLALIIIGYGFVASVLPVWLLLAPRDYLSTFLKIGTILLLAVGIIVVRPDLQMPAMTKFIDGSGPVWAGSLFPFLFITIACGAVSGWHALIASGTTPKMIENETQIRFIGYGGMLMESFVAIMAMIAATVIHPGVYFAMNSSAGADRHRRRAGGAGDLRLGLHRHARHADPDGRSDVGEIDASCRAPAARRHWPSAWRSILSGILGGKALTGIWYHFAILFEALFILTTVDAGTRVCRFMIQDLVGNVVPAFRATESWANNLIGSALACAAVGLLPLPGRDRSAGRHLDAVAAVRHRQPDAGGDRADLCTVVLFKMKRQRYAWVTIVPAVWLVAVHGDGRAGEGVQPESGGGLPRPCAQVRRRAGRRARSWRRRRRWPRCAGSCSTTTSTRRSPALFAAVVVAMVVYGVIHCRRALGDPKSTTHRDRRRRGARGSRR